MEEKIAAIAALGVTITATAIANNSTWPFVTIDQFQQRSTSARSLSGSYFLQLAPIITNETRLAWEKYSVSNTGWLTEAREYQAEKGMGFKGGDPVVQKHIIKTDETGLNLEVDQGVSIKTENGDVTSNIFDLPTLNYRCFDP